MHSVVNALQDSALSLINCVSKELGGLVTGYIDPNTMHHVFTFLGPILVFFAAVASVAVSAFLFFRYRMVTWLKKASRLKLYTVGLVFALGLIIVIAVVYKAILHLTMH